MASRTPLCADHAAIEEPKVLGNPGARPRGLFPVVFGIDVERLVILAGQTGLLKTLHAGDQARGRRRHCIRAQSFQIEVRLGELVKLGRGQKHDRVVQRVEDVIVPELAHRRAELVTVDYFAGLSCHSRVTVFQSGATPPDDWSIGVEIR